MWFAIIIVLALLIVGSRHFEHFADFADKLYRNALISKNLNWGVGSAAAWKGARSTGGLFALDERNNDDCDDLRTPGGAHVSA